MHNVYNMKIEGFVNKLAIFHRIPTRHHEVSVTHLQYQEFQRYLFVKFDVFINFIADLAPARWSTCVKEGWKVCKSFVPLEIFEINVFLMCMKFHQLKIFTTNLCVTWIFTSLSTSTLIWWFEYRQNISKDWLITSSANINNRRLI